MVSSPSKGTKDMIGWSALELKRGRSAREPGRSFRSYASSCNQQRFYPLFCSMEYTNTQRFILALKAGRALRRDGTNFVDPKPEKGAIILYDGEDDLLHFVWKDRTTGNVEEVRVVTIIYRSSRFAG